MTEVESDHVKPSLSRKWIGLLGIVFGTAAGMILVTLIRDGSVDWGRLLPLVAGAAVGAGIVNFIFNR